MKSATDHGRKRYAMVVVLGAVTVAGVLAVAGVAWQSYSAAQWDDQFTADLARGLAEVVPRAVETAVKEAEADVARISVNGKGITLAELVHWRELYARGGVDALRRAVSARFTPAEQRQLAPELGRLVECWREKWGQDLVPVPVQDNSASSHPREEQTTSGP